MKLRNEGPVRPAPILMGHAAMVLAAAVEHWPGVRSFTHWRLGSRGTVDGAEYHVGEAELGHVHLDSTAHVLLNRTTVALLEQRRLRRSPSWSDVWISQPVRSSAEVQHATWLFRLGYDRLTGTTEEDILHRIGSAKISAEATITI